MRKAALSYAQKRLWLLDQLTENKKLYNIPRGYEIQGELNEELLRKTLDYLVARHASFRTNFCYENGEPKQIVKANLPNYFHRMEDANPDLQAIADKAIDLADNPLFQVYLIKVDANRYYLVFLIHHIIADGWSMSVLINEFNRVYAAFAKNESAELNEIEIDYADFSEWQNELLTSTELTEQQDYWLQQLKGIPEDLSLPTKSMTRPAVLTNEGNIIQHTVAKETLQTFNTLLANNRATLYMGLLAVFQYLLSCYSQENIVVSGTPIANRHYQGSEEIIGYFANTLPVKAICDPELSFTDYLTQISTTVLELYDNQDLPFNYLLELLGIKPEKNKNPLFQTLFVLHADSAEQLLIPQVVCKEIDFKRNTAKFDLSLAAKVVDGQLQLEFEYATELFAEETIQRMAQHFTNILTRVAAKPATKLKEIHYLSSQEEDNYLRDWHQVTETKLQYMSLAKMFEAQVIKTPESIAVQYNNNWLTYNELNQRANQLANRITNYSQKNNLPEKNKLILLSAERGLELIIAILAILKSGNAYVPIDPAAPAERIKFILEDTQADLLLTQSSLQLKFTDLFDQQDLAVILTDSQEESFSTDNLTVNHSVDDLAYVIYTSGTSGKPKGVLQTQQNVMRLFSSSESLFDFNENDVWTLFHSYTFDFSVWEILGALLYGGKLLIPSHELTRDPEAFYQWVVDNQVTCLNQTPSSFQHFMYFDEKYSSENLALRYIVFGGEALNVQTLTDWFKRHTEIKPKLINMYGITETTVHVTYKLLSQSDLQCSASNIGKALPDLKIYLLDKAFRPVPIGVPGELYVSGPGVAKGYLNRPKLTAERFIKNPFVNDNQSEYQTLYKTGDLARWLDNSELEYLGRNDFQVKVRGFRIELGEIETRLNQYLAIKNSKVIARNNNLIAYLVVIDNQQLNLTELKTFLSVTLPDYMVPAHFILLDEIPLTINGKVDVAALPSVESTHRLAVNHDTFAKNSVEKRIVAIWQELLSVKSISTAENFFDLGGDSLKIVMLKKLLDENFDKKITITELFANTTIAQLAAFYQSTSTEEVAEQTANRSTQQRRAFNKFSRNKRAQV